MDSAPRKPPEHQDIQSPVPAWTPPRAPPMRSATLYAAQVPCPTGHITQHPVRSSHELRHCAGRAKAPLQCLKGRVLTQDQEARGSSLGAHAHTKAGGPSLEGAPAVFQGVLLATESVSGNVWYLQWFQLWGLGDSPPFLFLSVGWRAHDLSTLPPPKLAFE